MNITGERESLMRSRTSSTYLSKLGLSAAASCELRVCSQDSTTGFQPDDEAKYMKYMKNMKYMKLIVYWMNKWWIKMLSIKLKNYNNKLVR